MMPVLKPNDPVIVSSIPYLFTKPKKSDIIAFRYNNKPRTGGVRGKVLVKRIDKISSDRVLVSGDNKVDSLTTEPISKREILGKVIFKF